MRNRDVWYLGLLGCLAFLLCLAAAAGAAYAAGEALRAVAGLVGCRLWPSGLTVIHGLVMLVLTPLLMGEAVPSLSGVYLRLRFGDE